MADPFSDAFDAQIREHCLTEAQRQINRSVHLAIVESQLHARVEVVTPAGGRIIQLATTDQVSPEDRMS